MSSFLLVGVGGAAGAMARYALSIATPARPDGWPLATFLANVSGGLLIGLLAGWAISRDPSAEPARLLLGVGALGGFTTFSAFSLETVLLVERGRLPLAAGYAIASVVASLATAALGLWIARRVLP